MVSKLVTNGKAEETISCSRDTADCYEFDKNKC